MLITINEENNFSEEKTSALPRRSLWLCGYPPQPKMPGTTLFILLFYPVPLHTLTGHVHLSGQKHTGTGWAGSPSAAG